MWGATAFKPDSAVAQIRFQSTRPVWGATKMGGTERGRKDISIHAPRVGRDLAIWQPFIYIRISIHAPRVGRDYVVGAVW